MAVYTHVLPVFRLGVSREPTKFMLPPGLPPLTGEPGAHEI
jgi:hypothetical protein